MKFFGTLAIAATLGLASLAPADAHQSFPPFTNSILKADLATPAGMTAWRDAVTQAGAKSMIYADWHLLHFTKSSLFDGLIPEGAQPRGDQEACAALSARQGGKIALSGQVAPGDNHLLVQMQLDLDRLPAFTLVGCEPVIGSGEEGLRIRGFFYVPDHRIETAEQYSFVPLNVEPSRLPKNFFN
jgi:hypothetical protein